MLPSHHHYLITFMSSTIPTKNTILYHYGKHSSRWGLRRRRGGWWIPKYHLRILIPMQPWCGQYQKSDPKDLHKKLVWHLRLHQVMCGPLALWSVFVCKRTILTSQNHCLVSGTRHRYLQFSSKKRTCHVDIAIWLSGGRAYWICAAVSCRSNVRPMLPVANDEMQW